MLKMIQLLESSRNSILKTISALTICVKSIAGGVSNNVNFNLKRERKLSPERGKVLALTGGGCCFSIIQTLGRILCYIDSSYLMCCSPILIKRVN